VSSNATKKGRAKKTNATSNVSNNAAADTQAVVEDTAIEEANATPNVTTNVSTDTNVSTNVTQPVFRVSQSSTQQPAFRYRPGDYPIFKGEDSEDVTDFLKKFNTIAKNHGITGSLYVEVLETRLEGVAKSWFSYQATPENEEEARKLFEGRFGLDSTKRDRLLTQALDRKQKKGESVADYLDAKGSMYKRAVGDIDLFFISSAVNGLDESLRERVREKDPETLTDLVAIAKKLEKKARQTTKQDPDVMGSVSEKVNEMMQPFVKQMAALQEQLKTKPVNFIDNSNRYDHKRYRDSSSTSSSSHRPEKRQNFGKGVCYKCGKPGHKAFECRSFVPRPNVPRTNNWQSRQTAPRSNFSSQDYRSNSYPNPRHGVNNVNHD
jgi:hypothetical protein